VDLFNFFSKWTVYEGGSNINCFSLCQDGIVIFFTKGIFPEILLPFLLSGKTEHFETAS